MSRMASFLAISSIVMLASCVSGADKVLEAKQSFLNVASYAHSRQLLQIWPTTTETTTTSTTEGDGGWSYPTTDPTQPTSEPTADPTETTTTTPRPTVEPTDKPTKEPSPDPTADPTQPTSEPTPDPIMPTEDPTKEPTEWEYHSVLLGKGGNNAVSYCAYNGEEIFDPFGEEGPLPIAVRCCLVDGDGGRSRDRNKNCLGRPRNYYEAKEICEGDSHGWPFDMRLCTVAEVVAGKVKGTGCWYDNYYTWTSDDCGGFQAMKADKIAHEGDELNTHDHAGNKDGGNDIVIGIVSAAVVFVLALSLVALFCYRRRQGKAKGIEIEERNVEPELKKDASGTSTGQTEIVEMNVADDMENDKVY